MEEKCDEVDDDEQKKPIQISDISHLKFTKTQDRAWLTADRKSSMQVGFLPIRPTRFWIVHFCENRDCKAFSYNGLCPLMSKDIGVSNMDNFHQPSFRSPQ